MSELTLPYKGKDWETRPISATCEVLITREKLCGEATTHAYPAMGGGWMALCAKHAQKHVYNSTSSAPGFKGEFPIADLINSGERFE